MTWSDPSSSREARVGDLVEAVEVMLARGHFYNIGSGGNTLERFAVPKSALEPVAQALAVLKATLERGHAAES